MSFSHFSCPQAVLRAKRLFPRGYDAQGDSRERLRTCHATMPFPDVPGPTQSGHPALWNQPCLRTRLCTPSVARFAVHLLAATTGSQRSSESGLDAAQAKIARNSPVEPSLPAKSLTLLHVPCIIIPSSLAVKTNRKPVSPVAGSLTQDSARRMSAPVSPAVGRLTPAPSSSFPPVAFEYTSTLCIHARRGDVPRMHVSRSRTTAGRARGAFPHPRNCCSHAKVCMVDDRPRRACHARLACCRAVYPDAMFWALPCGLSVYLIVGNNFMKVILSFFLDHFKVLVLDAGLFERSNMRLSLLESCYVMTITTTSAGSSCSPELTVDGSPPQRPSPLQKRLCCCNQAPESSNLRHLASPR
jgi:hypothetical protein